MQEQTHAYLLNESICPDGMQVFHCITMSEMWQQHLGSLFWVHAFMPSIAEAYLKLIMVGDVLTHDQRWCVSLACIVVGTRDNVVWLCIRVPVLLLWHQGSAPSRAVTPLRAGLAFIDGWVKGVAARGAEGALLCTSWHLTKFTAWHVYLNDSWRYLHTSDNQKSSSMFWTLLQHAVYGLWVQMIRILLHAKLASFEVYSLGNTGV